MSAEKKVRVNSQIRETEVRLIDAEGEQRGVVSITEALSIAETAGMDLVEVSPNVRPPVCKVMDFGKYKFQLNKKTAAAKKKQKQIQIKEIKFRPTTEQGDFDVKLRKIIGFLEKGNKVKITVRFRGRELVHKELGEAILQRLMKALEEHAVIEQMPKFEGRQVMMSVAPKRA